MRTNLLSALLFSTILFVPGVALADPPDLCADEDEGFRPIPITTPGDFNKVAKADEGPPGQNNDEGFTNPANVAAQERNLERKVACPPPGQTP
jgi:hypothetical protein